jgi:hypothetical protein
MATPGASASDQYVFRRDCTLEAMRTRGRFSYFVRRRRNVTNDFHEN